MSKIINQAAIILGSKSDLNWAKQIGSNLTDFEIKYKIHIASAHKSPEYLLQIIREYEKSSVRLVFIAIAGRSNALGGFIDANTHFPVINCPPPTDRYAGLDILSSLRMPSGVAPATVLEPDHAAVLALKILSLADPPLTKKIITYHKKLVEKIKVDDRSLK